MSDQEIELTSWTRFLTRDLVVVPKLLGRFHEFNFNGSLVKVRLPSKDRVQKDERRDSIVSMGSWKVIGCKEVPLSYNVHSVDITIAIGERAVVPEDALSSPNLTYKNYSEAQKIYLDRLAAKYEEIAGQSFDLWVRTLRWKSGNSLIARPEIHGSESGWSTYLYQRNTNQRVAASISTLSVTLSRPVTVKEWNESGKALSSGKTPPVFIEILFDAMEHKRHGDYQRSVVDTAVASESYMRGVVAESLPRRVSASLKKFIDDANIRQVVMRFFPELLGEEERKTYKKFESSLHKLFDLRNTILHSGRVDGLSNEDCAKYIKVARQLITLRPRKPSG